jgi:site-specific recombinase XerD
LSERRYSSSVIQLYLFGIIPLGGWLKSNRLKSSDFNFDALARFRLHRSGIKQWRYKNGKIKAAYLGAIRFHEYLVINKITTGAPDPMLSIFALQRDFEQWMTTHRGVSDVTLRGYAPYVRALIDQLGQDPSVYSAASLRRFVLNNGKRAGIRTSSVSSTLTAVRAFIRFLVATKQCSSELPGALPQLAQWRLSTLPSIITAAEVQCLVDSCVQCPLTARRDRAALMMMWSLALRAGDIANLDLCDIDWGEARLRFSGKNRRETWLPLTQDVGDALIDYLQNERPDLDCCTRVFVKSTAPSGPICRSTVAWIVRRAFLRTGIKPAATGSHIIRRSAATDMLRHDASLSQIGSILRHENLQTTQLYAKLDQGLLLSVATPWPTQAGATVAGTNSTKSVNALESTSC